LEKWLNCIITDINYNYILLVIYIYMHTFIIQLSFSPFLPFSVYSLSLSLSVLFFFFFYFFSFSFYSRHVHARTRNLRDKTWLCQNMTAAHEVSVARAPISVAEMMQFSRLSRFRYIRASIFHVFLKSGLQKILQNS